MTADDATASRATRERNNSPLALSSLPSRAFAFVVIHFFLAVSFFQPQASKAFPARR
jgi:hypothetical protein